MEITSKNNSFIKMLKKEKAKSKFLLFLDTPILVQEAIDNNLNLKYLLIEKEKQHNFAIKIDAGKVIFVAKEVLASLSSVITNAGILGIFELEKKEYQAPKGNFLVLDGLQDAGNIGTLLRTALASNFKFVYLLDCVSLTNEKLIRSSAGTIFKLNAFELSRQEFVLKFKNDNLYYTDMGKTNIFSFKPPQPIGLVLGNEGNGVSYELKQLAKNKALSLPMENGTESLNVAVSGAIIMYLMNFGG